jgi:nitrate reductase gamma subunit
MSSIAFVLNHITFYIAILIFVGGLAFQIYGWRQKKPVAAHLSLFPRPEGRAARLADALTDMFTLKGLWKVNKPLWVGAFIMHLGLLLLLLGHVRVVTDYYFLWDLLGWGEEAQHEFSALAGTLAGVLFTVPLLYLLGRRLSGAVKWLSTPEDFFLLLLLMVIGLTGFHMRLVLDVDQHEVRRFMQGLLTFNWQSVPESAGASFTYHFSFVQILMIYFPFSKLQHTIGSVFSKMVARS